MMERAAEVDAQRKLLETLLKIKIDGQKMLKDTASASQHAEGVILNAVRCSAKYFKDGTAEVVMAAPIDGLATISAGLGQKGGPLLTVSEIDATGLIVDATGLSFEPVLGPELLGSNGTELYAPDIVAVGYVHQYGVVGYRSSLEAAKADPRIGNNPVIVKALKVTARPGQLVLAAKDGEILKRLRTKSGLLSQGRVIIVADKITD